jgi:hypothetical protein
MIDTLPDPQGTHERRQQFGHVRARPIADKSAGPMLRNP